MGRTINSFSLSFIFLLLFAGCDGGLVGTSTGPKVVSDLPRLPKKISPVIPRSIAGGNRGTNFSASTASKPHSISNSSRIQADTQQTSSRSWQLLQPSFQEIDSTRISVQEVLTLLDSEFESILYFCTDPLLRAEQCVIEAGEIEAFYDETITRQMIAIHKTADANTRETDIAEDNETNELREYYSSLEGSSVVFNQLSIRTDPTGAHRFKLITSTDALLQGRELQLGWSPHYDQITYELNASGTANQSELFNYRQNSTGQRLTVQRNQSNTESDAGTMLIEVTAQSTDSGDVFYNARLDDHFISGQASEETAYAYTKEFETEDGAYFQEIFDVAGYLIALQECSLETGHLCDDIDPEDEIHELYISPDEFDKAVDALGFDDIEVINLPPHVRDFLIVESDPDTPLWLRDEYCEGWQPIAGEIELFCFVPDLELDDVVFVSVNQDQLSIIPEARVLIAE